VTTPGRARTAAATAKRTRTKHDRWIRELSAAGWTVIQAGHITLTARADYAENVALYLDCSRCNQNVTEWDQTYSYPTGAVPLPRVLHAVTGHTCEERG
jgi:hypothetical protein